MKRICLIMPVAKFHSSDATSVPPYALLYVGSALKRAGYDVEIFHDADFDKVVSDVVSKDNLFVGISAFTGFPVWLACQYAKRIKELKPDTKIVLGGYHASILGEQVLMEDFFDFAVMGEGEKTAVELADALSNDKTGLSGGICLDGIQGLIWKRDCAIITNDKRPFEKNIDFDIDWSLVDLNRYTKRVAHLGGKRYFYIFTSRGCPGNCSFCSAAYIYNRLYRKESTEHAIRQYKPVIDGYGVDLVEYLDDNFFVDLKWAEEVVTGIGKPYRALIRLDRIDENVCDLLNRTNCRAIFVGIESGNEMVRNRIMHKNLSDEQIYKAVKLLAEKCPQINVSAMFIAGIPGEKYMDFIDTCKMAVELTELNPKLLPQLNVYAPYPMCDSYVEATRNGWTPPSKTEDWILDSKPGKSVEPVWLDYYHKGLVSKLKWVSVSFLILKRHGNQNGFKKFVMWVLRKISLYRLNHDFFSFPIELWLFWKLYLRMVNKDVS